MADEKPTEASSPAVIESEASHTDGVKNEPGEEKQKVEKIIPTRTSPFSLISST